MSDAGVVEEWVYQGGTFTSTNSWMQGGSGGNMILEWNTDVATTRKQIKQADRKSGMQISYKHPDNGWLNEQYIGTTFTDTAWSNDINWEKVPNQKQLTELKNDILQIEGLFSKTKNLAIITRYNGYLDGLGNVVETNIYDSSLIKLEAGETYYVNQERGSNIRIFKKQDDSYIQVDNTSATKYEYTVLSDGNEYWLQTVVFKEDGIVKSRTWVSKGEDLIEYTPPLALSELNEFKCVLNIATALSYGFTVFDYYTLKKGTYYNLTSQAAPENAVYDNSFASLKIPVFKGDIITLKTKGGSIGRAYALTDTNREIYEVAEESADYLSGGKKINIIKDGYLYVNCTTQEAARIFELIIEYASIALLNERVDELAKSISKKIRVLSISNSYGCDALGYAPKILESMGIANYEFAVAYHGSCSLQSHVENIGTPYYTFHYTYNGEWKSESNKDLLYILQKYQWDYIVFQQYSALSDDYSTYTPYMNDLMKYVSENVNNKVEFSFNMTQQYPSDNETMLDGIKDAMKKLYTDFGLKIIPVGISVQNARNTDLNQYGEGTQLTSDRTHLEDGIGRLLASYTWIKFLLGIDIWSANYFPQYPLDIKIPDGPRKAFTNVTEEMAWIAKNCVGKTIRDINKLLLAE